MSDAIRTWMIALENYPGWKEWRRQQMGYTLYYDDPFPPTREFGNEFVFSEEIDKQHAVILQYLGLLQTVHALKETEFYFRRVAYARRSGRTTCCVEGGEAITCSWFVPTSGAAPWTASPTA